MLPPKPSPPFSPCRHCHPPTPTPKFTPPLSSKMPPASSPAPLKASLEGVEVPIIGSDKLKWVEVTVPHAVSPSAANALPSHPPSLQPPAAAVCQSAASCHIVPGDPPAYLIWRIHEDHPNVLEVIEIFPSKDLPENALRLVFPATLHPFAYACKNEAKNTAGEQHMIYALTVSGIAYVLNLRSPSSYLSGSIFPQNELVVHGVQSHSHITAVAATYGFLVVGRQDGSVGCYQLGTLDPNAPGFSFEFRDDVGLGRLWNLMSRGRVVGPVQDLIISEVLGRKLLFAAHLDGSLRIWDLTSNVRVLSHSFCFPESSGSTLHRFWVGDVNFETGQALVAILYRGSSRSTSETIAVYSLSFIGGEKVTLLSDSPMQIIPLNEGRLIDIKLTSDKLWMLKEDGSMLYDLFCLDAKMESAYRYNLHEDFIADQLFQGSEHPSDDLIWTNLSSCSSLKDQVPYVISSVFLRRLLQPGVFLSSALYATIMDQKKYIAEQEVQSLTVSGLKHEMLSIIESEGLAANPSLVLQYWKSFCSHFFRHWCQSNIPCSLFVDSSSGAVVLIRKSSISLFRQLEHIEIAIYGSSEEFCDLRRSGLTLPGSDVDCEILLEVLRCIGIISHQLGKTANSVIYESIIDPSIFSNEDIIFHLIKVLDTGYCSSQADEYVCWEKKQADHKIHRKFSVDMLLLLHALCAKATKWGRVLDVIEQYLSNFIPDKFVQHMDTKGFFNINSRLLICATSQIAKVTSDCAFDMLMFLGYLVNVSAQVHMVPVDLSRIKLKIVPMLLDILVHWSILHFVGTTPTETPSVEDFSSKLSSLHIDNNTDKSPGHGKLGTSGFTLACLFESPLFTAGRGFLSSSSFPHPSKFIGPIRNICSQIIRNKTGEEFQVSFSSIMELACLLVQHGQYEAVEKLLTIVDGHTSKKMGIQRVQGTDGEWSACFHLLGFCMLLRAQVKLNGTLKEWKIHEAVRCFFRTASGGGAAAALQNLSSQTGFLYSGDVGLTSVWRFFYYQWAMQLFEHYNLSEAACQFALAALEQVDDVLGDDNSGAELLPEPAITIRGRLWANVFKFTLDINQYWGAYCAIISNPDEDSKYICLRRFINVLCERRETKILWDGELPFVGLVEKVEQELVWKSERSDISLRPNLYKLLYAFEVCHNNWRKAASYMHRYTLRLRKEVNVNENNQSTSAFQEILYALSASINCLQLVSASQSWIDSQHESYFCFDQSSPNKRARKDLTDKSFPAVNSESDKSHCYTDIEKLEKEYVLTLAQYLLSLAKIQFTITGNVKNIANAVDALVQANLYDVAFTVLLKFWKGSKLKSELERVFVTMSQKCCAYMISSSLVGVDIPRGLLSPSSDDAAHINGKVDDTPMIYQSSGNPNWEMLELYVEKYRSLHPRIPVTVAEALLNTDPQIELPLWLVHMFKGGRKATSWGMTGHESDPATLFRLYVDYGRYAEATNLLLEYIEAFSALRPVDVNNRKRMSAIWFPYVAIERLWCHLEEVQNSGHMVDQCDKLKRLLHGVLQNHLKQVKVDSNDAMAYASV